MAKSKIFETSLCWLPEETLFSWCSRYHQIVGHLVSSLTCQQLFGHLQRGSQHDFPCRLGEFVQRTYGRLGSSIDIIYGHTLLPFYLPWKSIELQTLVLNTIQIDGLGSLKYRLGLLTSRFRAHHPLKACLACFRADIEQYGVAYWHVIHQYPGVCVCNKHNQILYESTLKSNGVGRFQWSLPTLNTLVPPSVFEEGLSSAVSNEVMKHSLAFSSLCCKVASLPSAFFIDPNVMWESYRYQLAEMGLYQSQRLRISKIADLIFARSVHLRYFPALNAFPSSQDEAARQMNRLLYQPRSGCHPLWHLLIIFTLFETWDAFQEIYKMVGSVSIDPTVILSPDSELSPGEMLSQELPVKLIELLKNGSSYRNAARQIGIDTTTAMVWAAKAGLKPKRRPKRLQPYARTQLIEDLRKGEDKNELAKIYGVSVQAITTVMRTEPKLSEAWHSARDAKALNINRACWSALMENCPTLSCKALRTLAPATYMWLYRNDPSWLKQKCQYLPKPPRSNHKSVDWNARDIEFSQAVLRVAQEATRDAPEFRITVQLIYQQIPELRPKLSQLNKLPLTRKAINSVVHGD